MTPFAVCIVTHDSEADVGGCLEAVESLRPQPEQVVIVDSGSRDSSVRAARESGHRLGILVVELGENLGFAAAMNVGVRSTRAPLLLSLNPDARPAPDYVARLVDRFDASPDRRIGALTGKLVRPADNGAQRLDAAGMRLTLTWRHLDRGSSQIDTGQFSRPERVFGATGAATLFSRPALEDVAVDGEFFLEEFHSYREDAELAFRLQERGWEVHYEPDARCVHRRANLPERRREMSAAINRHSLKNRYLLRCYHQTPANFVTTFLPAAARDIGIGLYVLALERTSLDAYRWLWRHRRAIRQRRRVIQQRRTAPSARVDAWFLRPSEPL